jgi:hypothetical protein
MPFGAHIFSLLEDALAEAFQYHTALDNFVRRSGIPDDRLIAARARAENRAKGSARRFSRAPKRFVAQELLDDLGNGGEQEDRMVAGLVTALCKRKVSRSEPKGQNGDRNVDGGASHRTSGSRNATRRVARHGT